MRGLLNKHNNCYVNSVVQATSSIPPLWELVGREYTESDESTVLRAIGNLFSLLQRNQQDPVDPERVLLVSNAASSDNGEEAYGNHTQRDAHQFLTWLLERIREQMSDRGRRELLALFSISAKQTSVCERAGRSKTGGQTMDYIPLYPDQSLTTHTVQSLIRATC